MAGCYSRLGYGSWYKTFNFYSPLITTNNVLLSGICISDTYLVSGWALHKYWQKWCHSQASIQVALPVIRVQNNIHKIYNLILLAIFQAVKCMKHRWVSANKKLCTIYGIFVIKMGMCRVNQAPPRLASKWKQVPFRSKIVLMFKQNWFSENSYANALS